MSQDTLSPSQPKKGALCPLCGQAQVKEWRPFCSPRCRDTDLFRWLNGSYVIPGSLESSGGQEGSLSSEEDTENTQDTDEAEG